MSVLHACTKNPSQLLVAVATDDELTLSSHAGRAKHWDIYTISRDNAQSKFLWSIALNSSGTLHEWHVSDDGNRHPLHQVDYAIAGSAGDGVRNKLALRNTELITTNEADVQSILRYFIEGQKPPSNHAHEQICLDPEHRAARSA
ncbi:NifB/NifX family molybdenum-iron cluster-binding protein [Sessilibacter sp. MAH2]